MIPLQTLFALFAALAVVSVAYLVALVASLRVRADGARPTRPMSIVGFIASFFTAFGFSSFATTIVMARPFKLVDDEDIPGSLVVGYTIPTALLAFVTIKSVPDVMTLVPMVVAAMVGAWVGARVVSTWPRRPIQVGMAVCLLLTAALSLVLRIGLSLGIGDAVAFSGTTLLVGVVVNFLLGTLMPLGLGLYTPYLILAYLLGLEPTAAFPLAMASVAFAMPVASIPVLRRGAYDPSAVLGMTLAGIPAVLIAVFAIRLVPLDVFRLVFVAGVALTALSLFRAAPLESGSKREERTAPRSSAPSGDEVGIERWFALAVLVFAVRMVWVWFPGSPGLLWGQLSTSMKVTGFLAPVVAVAIVALPRRTPRGVTLVVLAGIIGLAAPVIGIYNMINEIKMTGTASASSASGALAEILIAVPFVIAGGVAMFIAARSEVWTTLGTLLTPIVAAAVVVGDLTLVRQFTDAAMNGTPPTGVAGRMATWVIGTAHAEDAKTPAAVDTASVGPAPPSIFDNVYFEFQVEKPASPYPDNPRPAYPELLRAANVEGDVVAQFVIDTDGRADTSAFKVLRSTHDLFTDAVKASLPSMKFYPAEIGGHKVRQLMQLPFQFTLPPSGGSTDTFHVTGSVP